MFLDVPQLFSDVLSCFPMSPCAMHNHPLSGNFFLGMMSDVFRCSQLFSDVFRMSSIDHRYSIEILCVRDVLKSSQIFTDVTDDHRCFWIFSRYFVDVLLMFSRCSLDVLQMFSGCLQDFSRIFQYAPIGLVGLVEFDDHFK